MVIGKFYNSKTLENYNKGEQFPKLIAVNVENSLSAVMLSVFSREQASRDELKRMLRKTVNVSSFVIFPMMLGLSAIAKNIVIILLTEKWLGCVSYMQLLCVVYMFYPLNSANSQAIKSVGKSDTFLKVEIAKKSLGIIALFLTVKSGVYYIVLGQVFAAIGGALINAYPNKKILGYGCLNQIKDIFLTLIISLIMFIIVLLVGQINLNIYLVVLLQILIGVIVYFLIAKLLKLEAFDYINNIVKNKLKKGKK